MKKAIVLVVSAAMMALLLVGCGGGSKDAESTVASASDANASANVSAGEDASASASASAPDAAAKPAPDAAAKPSAEASKPSSDPAPSTEPPSSSEHEAGPWNIPCKTYAAYDRFSGDRYDSPTLVVRGVWIDRIVFDYARSDDSWSDVSVSLDSSGRGSVEIGTVTLDVALGDGFIEVDEIEGMGAMAYVFK